MVGFRRPVAKQSWDDLLSDYDVTRGRTWPLVLAWIAAGLIALVPRSARYPPRELNAYDGGGPVSTFTLRNP